ncbi:MAG: DUF6951 family protein [Chthonomonadales bacterium]
MSSADAIIHAGVCGFVTKVRAASTEDFRVRLELETPCSNIRAFAEALPKEVDALHEVRSGWDGVILSTARRSPKGCCSACAVPIGVFKVMQVAGGLALPRDVAIEITKD